MPFIQMQPVAAAMNTGMVPIGEHGIWFVASKLETDNPSVVNGDIRSPGEIPTNVFEYPGTVYSISSWMVPVGDHLNIDCQSNIRLTIFRDKTAISSSMPISVEDGNDYRVDDYKLKLDKTGQYFAKLTGGLNCKWKTDGRIEFYSAQKTYPLAKVISKKAPRPMSIKAFKCSSTFKISTSSNSLNKCAVTVVDPDHVADSMLLSMDTPQQLFTGLQLERNNSWKRTSLGWIVGLDIPVGMVSPTVNLNLRRAEQFNGMIYVKDTYIEKNESFTARTSLAIYPFTVTFSK